MRAIGVALGGGPGGPRGPLMEPTPRTAAPGGGLPGGVIRGGGPAGFPGLAGLGGVDMAPVFYGVFSGEKVLP
jgi:hypothetical protein